MLGVIIFDRLNDVMFSHGDDKYEEHIRGMAARNGLFYPAFSDTAPETRGERADVLLQLFSPFLASQRIMISEFHDPYTEVECENGLRMVFHEYLAYQCLCLAQDSGLSPQRYISAAVSLAKLLCGPVLNRLKASDGSLARLLSAMLTSYCQLQRSNQAYHVEAVERLIVCDLCMTDVSGGLCEAIESVARYQQAVTPFQRDQVSAHLKHGLAVLFSSAKQLRHSPEVRSLLSRLQTQWDQLRRLKVDTALTSGRPLPPAVDQGLAALSRTLEAAFEAVCHALPERDTLPSSRLVRLLQQVRSELDHYRSFLLARAVSNATVETRSHLNISRYLDNFPDLVHFIYVDRSVHLMTAPSARPPDGRHDLTSTVRNMIDLAYRYLREGHMSIIWRDQHYSYGHFLWFEDSMGNPQKALESPKRLKALYMDWQPGILARDYFSALVSVCFPDAAPEEVRCFQLFLVHRGPVQSARVLQQSQQIAKTVWEVSGAAATPLDLL